MNGAEMDGSRVVSVVCQDVRSGRRVRVGGRWFLDSTGDGSLGFFGGRRLRTNTNRAHGRQQPFGISSVSVRTRTRSLRNSKRRVKKPPFRAVPGRSICLQNLSREGIGARKLHKRESSPSAWANGIGNRDLTATPSKTWSEFGIRTSEPCMAHGMPSKMSKNATPPIA